MTQRFRSDSASIHATKGGHDAGGLEAAVSQPPRSGWCAFRRTDHRLATGSTVGLLASRNRGPTIGRAYSFQGMHASGRTLGARCHLQTNSWSCKTAAKAVVMTRSPLGDACGGDGVDSGRRSAEQVDYNCLLRISCYAQPPHHNTTSTIAASRLSPSASPLSRCQLHLSCIATPHLGQ